ncbi:GerAB/ArcD/ProY family transporter [Paenibacillus prosopidis]|uniref:Spore germination protein KB n=1 Tax=Paenibacillus prosopidis TaxID=630520 RepID=A0A368W9Q9_9BACL|nr:GerAB/ArcD/ProY family transporter [Paenibacillus prosopidis]RCW51816.1 spore germination protein KB [Paenibacillus prosopidis]
MKDQETISTTQMATLYFAYITGSALIVIPGPLVTMSLNAAWLSILISLGIGIVLLNIMFYLHRRNPGLTFIGYSSKTIGRWPTVILACFMLTMALHMASGIIIDVSGFMTSMMLPETPDYVFMGMLYLLAAFFLRGGIESIARMFSVLVVIVMIFWALVLVLLIPQYHPEFLRPVFPEGIKPMLLGTYLTFGFPYGEVVLFAMVLPFARAKQSKPLKKAMVWAMVINGAVLIISTLCTIMELGPMASEKRFSVFVLAQMVEVGDIIERIEAVVGMAMLAGSLMKATITLYIIQLILTELFGLRNDRLLTNPLCVTALLLSLTLPATLHEWEEMVLVVHPIWVAAVYVLPLLIVAAVAFFKDLLADSTKEEAPSGNGSEGGSVK